MKPESFDAKDIDIKDTCLGYTSARIFYFGGACTRAACAKSACTRNAYIKSASTDDTCIASTYIRKAWIGDVFTDSTCAKGANIENTSIIGISWKQLKLDENTLI